MRLLTIILLGLIISSCKEKETDRQTTSKPFDIAKTYNAFEKQIKEHIDNWNKENKDTLDTKIELDSTFIFNVYNSEMSVVLSQYHTKDKRKIYGIVSIENFSDKGLPTFLISDPRADKFLGDSVVLTTDNLLIYGRTIINGETEDFQISFDTKFDGKKFPWNME